MRSNGRSSRTFQGEQSNAPISSANCSFPSASQVDQDASVATICSPINSAAMSPAGFGSAPSLRTSITTSFSPGRKYFPIDPTSGAWKLLPESASSPLIYALYTLSAVATIRASCVIRLNSSGSRFCGTLNFFVKTRLTFGAILFQSPRDHIHFALRIGASESTVVISG